MSPYEIMQYYARLLIIQYIGKPKAFATIEALSASLIQLQESVEVISFSAVPDSGQFTLFYGEDETAALLSTATASDVQTALRAISGLSSVTVSGSYASGFTVLFVDVLPPALPLSVGSNTLQSGVDAVSITIAETDKTLPLAVQNGYNLTGNDVAIGSQLDVLGKYVGVLRTARGFSNFITLNDSDYLSLIRIAILKNSAQSDLATIQQLLFDFFQGQLYVFDYKNMRMSYLISSSVGSQELVELFVTQDLLPVPMAVEVSIVYGPVIDSFFGFCDYRLPAPLVLNTPLNDYLDYQTDWPWLSYANSVSP